MLSLMPELVTASVVVQNKRIELSACRGSSGALQLGLFHTGAGGTISRLSSTRRFRAAAVSCTYSDCGRALGKIWLCPNLIYIRQSLDLSPPEP